MGPEPVFFFSLKIRPVSPKNGMGALYTLPEHPALAKVPPGYHGPKLPGNTSTDPHLAPKHASFIDKLAASAYLPFTSVSRGLGVCV